MAGREPGALARGLVGGALLSAALVVAALVGVAVFGSAVVTSMLIAVTAVIGLQVYFGNSGILSMGHAGFVALGAYVSGILTMPVATKATVLPQLPGWLAGIELGLPPALVVTALLVGAAAAAIGYVIVRLGGYAAAIASLGVLVIVHVVLLGVPALTRGAQTFYGIPPLTSFPVALAAAVAAVVVARLFRESRLGLQLRASREDELAAQSFGVNVRLRRLQAWTLGAVMAAIAGALLAHLITAFSPKQFYFPLTFSYIIMLIIGGAATVTGAIGGAAIVLVVGEVLRTPESGIVVAGIKLGPFFGATQIVLALLMLLVMYFRRDGLFGLREPDEILQEWLSARRGAGKPVPPEPVADASKEVPDEGH
ncbi:MAG: branched-chain amino acid ABC transporter permease [Dongiaceae bacterium]